MRLAQFDKFIENHSMGQMLLTDSDLELLLEFEKNSSIDSLSRSIHKDPTVISRQLKRISEKADVLSKISGRWTINESGRRLNQATRDFIKIQGSILLKESHIRIGTNREFSARIIAKDISNFKDLIGAHSILLNTFEYGIESALLAGEIDLGFDCGRPQSPEIQFKHIHSEEIAIVTSPDYFKKFFKKNITPSEVMELPHIYCERLDPSPYLGVRDAIKNIIFSTNDISSARAACIESFGWAFLPTYAIHQEVESGLLQIIEPYRYSSESYGVWKLRSRVHLNDEFLTLTKWFKAMSSFK